MLSDSDSDLEDFQHVVADSLKALTFTERALTKRRRDVMETGIVLDPAEYVSSRPLGAVTSRRHETCTVCFAVTRRFTSLLFSITERVTGDVPRQHALSRRRRRRAAVESRRHQRHR